jgi:hypothetical protein
MFVGEPNTLWLRILKAQAVLCASSQPRRYSPQACILVFHGQRLDVCMCVYLMAGASDGHPGQLCFCSSPLNGISVGKDCEPSRTNSRQRGATKLSNQKSILTILRYYSLYTLSYLSLPITISWGLEVSMWPQIALRPMRPHVATSPILLLLLIFLLFLRLSIQYLLGSSSEWL